MRLLCVVISFSVAGSIVALPEAAGTRQKEYEASIEAAVRNKSYYKSGGFELSAVGGLMPYDLIVDHYNFGGRLTWHLSDHFGWELLDFQFFTSNFTSFTTELVSDTEKKKIERFDALKLKNFLGSNFLASPIYGKIRFLGSQVIYFDIYALLGLGMANTNTVRLSYLDQQGTVVNSSWNPAFTFGFGLKVFLNRALGVLIDFRDYVVSGTTYDTRSFKSNYTVMAGITVFLPPL